MTTLDERNLRLNEALHRFRDAESALRGTLRQIFEEETGLLYSQPIDVRVPRRNHDSWFTGEIQDYCWSMDDIWVIVQPRKLDGTPTAHLRHVARKDWAKNLRPKQESK